MSDLRIRDEGFACLLWDESDVGTAWLDEHVRTPETMTFSGAIVVEPKYVPAIIAAAEGDGLVVEHGMGWLRV